MRAFSCGVAGHVLHEQGLLQPADPELLEGRGGGQGRVEAVAHVCVGHEREVGSQRRTHGAHDLDVLGEVEAHLDLDAVEAPFRELLGLLHRGRGCLGIERGGVDLDRVAALAAQQLVHRHSLDLAGDVPQRDIHAAEGHHPDPSGTEGANAGAEVGRVPDLLDGEWVHADKKRLEHMGDDGFQHQSVARARTHARDSLVGVDLHQKRVAVGAYTRTAFHLALSAHRRAQAQSLDVGYPHLNPTSFHNGAWPWLPSPGKLRSIAAEQKGALRLRFATPVLSLVEGLRANGVSIWRPEPEV